MSRAFIFVHFVSEFCYTPIIRLSYPFIELLDINIAIF